MSVSKRDKKENSTLFLIHRDGANSIQSNWKFDLERKFNLLRTRRWPRILPSFSPLAWPSRHLRIEREYSERIFCQSFRDARRKREERRLPREEFKSNGGESPTLLLVSNGRERRTRRRRSASRNARFSLRRRAPYLFSSLEASLLPWVSLVCVVFITRGVVKPNAIGMTPFEGRKGLESCCFFFVPFFLHFFHWASSIDFLLPELPPHKKKTNTGFFWSLSLSLDRNVFNSIN